MTGERILLVDDEDNLRTMRPRRWRFALRGGARRRCARR